MLQAMLLFACVLIGIITLLHGLNKANKEGTAGQVAGVLLAFVGAFFICYGAAALYLYAVPPVEIPAPASSVPIPKTIKI